MNFQELEEPQKAQNKGDKSPNQQENPQISQKKQQKFKQKLEEADEYQDNKPNKSNNFPVQSSKNIEINEEMPSSSSSDTTRRHRGRKKNSNLLSYQLQNQKKQQRLQEELKKKKEEKLRQIYGAQIPPQILLQENGKKMQSEKFNTSHVPINMLNNLIKHLIQIYQEQIKNSLCAKGASNLIWSCRSKKIKK
ncbi:hypothetical protein PPERSA_05404 [Pseudocohnilembus persalinus]|uniref:Uncharacterized protein n=1 Tax=Pseudocohnilembus persalinus TaxID=266149 RepID=A0A0V0R8P9_PSEPJ|nr:hypothetical protein PPERSA_05404 [Pseudocohnilembus persalinus]|eukprot:KRX10584.1 hypothetical protein PPERSA_05404 [Pseudocohnilembus persalinus]